MLKSQNTFTNEISVRVLQCPRADRLRGNLLFFVPSDVKSAKVLSSDKFENATGEVKYISV